MGTINIYGEVVEQGPPPKEKQDKSGLREVLTFISNNKMDLFEVSTNADKEYNAFIINQCVGSDRRYINEANLMNHYYKLSNQMQFDFYYYGLPQSSLHGSIKWSPVNFNNPIKKLKTEVDRRLSKSCPNDEKRYLLQCVKCKYIMMYYNYSYDKAMEVIDMVTDEYYNEIVKSFNNGGKNVK